MKVEYVDHMGSDLTVVNAARVSFNKHKDKFDDNDHRLLTHLSKYGHWTPFAHPQITVRIKAPIFIRTQCFKHKQGFVENEVSRRYVDYEPEVFIPDVWRGRPNDSKQGSSGEVEDQTQCHDYYELALERCIETYNILLANEVAPEQARMVLPQGMYTEWYWTGSLASYARFYKQRIDSHAQKEIQDLAKMVGEVIKPLFPVSWKVLT